MQDYLFSCLVPSPPGLVKFNSDGSVEGNSGQSSIGGLFRDSLVVCLPSFWGAASLCIVNEADLVALRMGLMEAVKLCIHYFILEGCSSCVTRRALGTSSFPWCLADAVEEVLELATKLNASFVNVLRSANEAADSLGKEGVSQHTIVVDMVPP